ncbi:hypothetical protein BJF79_03365 [Actinomadura sp. CNU-125]|uniref:DUF397 domain-containing protein n=1 Tax=Actinomadura sp. CNU-125 TaxID=1904961 RepID=UPI000969278D|nr:DUF397 domain-containing protein [Actinomadura sp. CNU-125]OLT12952.1 hypothetical protein BJF79_03365 [Actinomadura sp. CNU-125]
MDATTVERLKSAAFRKAGGSGDIGCVEVAFVEDAAGVRDSYDRSGPMLAFTAPAWVTFTTAVRTGRYDLSRG